MSPVPASVGEEGQAGPKPEQVLSIREGARAPGGSSWLPPTVRWPPAGLPAPALASSSGVIAAASEILLSGAIHGSVPRAEAGFCGFLASGPLHPYSWLPPKPTLRSLPSSLCIMHLGPVPPPFRSHAGGIFSERPFLISLSKVRTFFSQNTYCSPLLYFPL